jgi:hypothetical protein
METTNQLEMEGEDIFACGEGEDTVTDLIKLKET